MVGHSKDVPFSFPEWLRLHLRWIAKLGLADMTQVESYVRGLNLAVSCLFFLCYICWGWNIENGFFIYVSCKWKEIGDKSQDDPSLFSIGSLSIRGLWYPETAMSSVNQNEQSMTQTWKSTMLPLLLLLLLFDCLM